MKTHATGASRSTDADGARFDLIPQVGLCRLAETMREGAEKYDPNNWRKGFQFSDTVNHALTHFNKFLMGDRSEDHLAHIAANVFFLMEFQQIHPELDDLLKTDDYLAPSAGQLEIDSNIGLVPALEWSSPLKEIPVHDATHVPVPRIYDPDDEGSDRF